jgi:hypothetical protein
MDPQRRALGPATTRFTDYVGTVAADDAEAVMDRPSLYELAQSIEIATPWWESS